MSDDRRSAPEAPPRWTENPSYSPEPHWRRNETPLTRFLGGSPGGVFLRNGSFGGPFHNRARRVFSGSPLNGPISSALLPNGHIVLANTLNPAGSNIMVEISPSRDKVVATKNVDTGAAGALFGMVATGTSDDDVQLFYNDDNTNSLNVLRR